MNKAEIVADIVKNSGLVNLSGGASNVAAIDFHLR